ncbi:MAG: D-hexose-6-phosphate mutarotase [Chthoniobacterales bacterium]
MNKENLQQFEIPSYISFLNDSDQLQKILVTTSVSMAEIYLQGAHVTSFQKKGEAPLLFASEAMKGAHGKIVHGGIPICFPWFGIHEGEKLSHGFARTTDWKLVETEMISEEAVLLRFELPSEPMIASGWPPVKAQLIVTISSELTLELLLTNTTEHDFIFEDCFHAYFFVGDISQVTIAGLKNLDYLDKVEDLACKHEISDAIPIVGETNRIYLQSTGTIEINDRSLQRLIRIEKRDSQSTVVWNPWILKSHAWPDLHDDDYQKFLCVESGNVAESRKNVAPGATSSMKVTWGTICIEKEK